MEMWKRQGLYVDFHKLHDTYKNKFFYNSQLKIGEKKHYEKKLLDKGFWEFFLKIF